MAEKVPRRMKRFYREQSPEGDSGTEFDDALYRQVGQGSRGASKRTGEVDKDITMQLAAQEVKRFKQQHKRMPSKEEYERIADSIFRQLKEKEDRRKIVERLDTRQAREREKPLPKGRRERGRRRGKKPGKETPEFAGPETSDSSLSEEEVKGLSIEDMFSEPGKEKPKGQQQEKQGKSMEEEFSLGELEGLEGKEPGSGQKKCPNCGNPAKEIVFCPGCGSAFCEKCAKKVETIGNVKSLTCPSCGTKIKK